MARILQHGAALVDTRADGSGVIGQMIKSPVKLF